MTGLKGKMLQMTTVLTAPNGDTFRVYRTANEAYAAEIAARIYPEGIGLDDTANMPWVWCRVEYHTCDSCEGGVWAFVAADESSPFETADQAYDDAMKVMA